MTGRSVIVVGSANCDMTVRVHMLPSPHQTVLGRDSRLTVGGKGLNQAVAAAVSGAGVALIGAVGTDYFGNQIQDYLRWVDVDVAQVQVISGAASGVAIITIDDDGNNVIAVAPGANASVSPDNVASALAAADDARVALFQLEIPIEAVAAGLRAARARGLTTILNPAPANREILPHLPWVDILTPNESELAELADMPLEAIEAGGSKLDEAMTKLQSLSGGTVITTRGSSGCVAYDGRAFHRLPAFRQQVTDSTGAGDVFNGALAACLARGTSLEESLTYASAAAAISVTKRSAQDSAPSRLEVEAFLSRADPQELNAFRWNVRC